MADVPMGDAPAPGGSGEAPKTGLDSADIWGEDDILTDDLKRASNDEIQQRIRLLDNDIRIMKSEQQRLTHEMKTIEEKTKDNTEKIKLNRQLPHLVANVAEILDLEPDEDDEDGATQDIDMQRKGKSLVIKTTTRQTIFLPVIGLVEAEDLKPNDLVGVNKDSYLVLDKLPAEYDSRVKAMEVDERPDDKYSDIGGLDKQIQELIEAIVLPMTHKERFETVGVTPPKGVLMHGPPGTGKTMMARACAAATNATFLKLAGPQLVQMFIGDGAKIVRDAFTLAREKAPAIIFIDELDAIGQKRSGGGELSGVREVQRTMLELLTNSLIRSCLTVNVGLCQSWVLCEMAVDLEEAFDIVGPYGRFQWATIFICGLGWALAAQSLLITPFISGPPDWRYVNSDDSLYSSGQGCEYNETKAWEWVDPQFSLRSSLTRQMESPCSAGEMQATSAASSFYFGMLLGAPVVSSAADRYGRKRVYVIGALTLLVAFAFSATAQSFVIYSGWRFVNGFAQGGVSNLCFMYPAEMVGKAFRGQVALFTSLGWVAGCIWISFLAYFVPEWRTLTCVTVAPAFVFTLASAPYLVESPAFLIAQQRVEDAQIALLTIARKNGIDDVESRVRGLAWDSIKNDSKDDETPQEGCEALVRRLRWRLLILSLVWMGCALGYNGISLGVGDLGSDIYTTAVMSAIVEVPAYVLSSWMVSSARLGRKWSAFCTSAFAACACVMSSLLTQGWRTLVALFGKFAISAAYVIIFLYTAELFPASVRSSAMGTVTTASRISSLFAPFILTLPAPMLIFGIVSGISVPGIALLPETLGQTIPTSLGDHSGKDILSLAECCGYEQLEEEHDEPPSKEMDTLPHGNISPTRVGKADFA